MTEAEIQIAVADYLRFKYPNALFHSDFGSGVKLTMGQAIKQKRMNGGRRAFPDIQICEPIGKWNGAFLELKKDGVKIIKRDGCLVSNEHIREQASVIGELRCRGYYADFAIGLDDAIRKIDIYLSGRANEEGWTDWCS